VTPLESLDITICVPHTSTRIHRTETVLARRFAQLGHRVRVVVFEVAEAGRRIHGLAAVDGIDFYVLRGARLAESIYLPAERRSAPGLSTPDVVHVTEDTQTITFWADRFARRVGRPLCVTTNRDRLPGTVGRRILYRNAERWFGRSVRETAPGFSVHTRGQLEYLRGRGMRRKDVLVIPNMVDTERFKPTTERSADPSMRFADAPLSFLSVGRLVPNKGYAHLLRAFATVAKERPEARLTIIGRGPQEARLRARIAEFGLGDKVLLHAAFVSNEELAQVYPHFDAYLQPSLVEPFGIAVLEAMACGLPVIASRDGGMAYSVVDGETGRLVPKGDEAALAGAMLEMADERLRRRLGEGSQRRAREIYDWKLVGDDYIGLYRHALAKPGPWRLALARAPRGSAAQPLRVAIGVATLGIGRGRNELALSRFLLGHGHQPVIVTCQIEGAGHKQPGWHEVDGVPVLVLPSLRLGAGIFLPTAKKRTLERDWVDLFHATEDSQGVTWWCARAARAAGRPFAVSTERYEPPSTRVSRLAYLGAEWAFARRVRRDADALAVRSEAVLKWLARRPGHRPRETMKIPNAVDAKHYRPDRPLHKLKGSDGHPSVLSVGRLAENKDYVTLIDAMEKVRAKHPEARATVLGRGPLKDALAARIAAKGLQDVVTLEESFVADESFPGIYPAFEVYAQPSRVEPMALSSLEAMASGMPVIASAVGGMTEVVRDGENGFLVPPGDVAALAAAIDKAADGATRARLSEGARRIALAEFDWAVVGVKWLKFYEAALRARPPGAPRGVSAAPEWSLS